MSPSPYPGAETRVLSDVSFAVRRGERVSIVGRNGAGKSTVVKLLCGLYRPDAGRVLVNGRDLRDLDRNTIRGLLSAVFQDYCCYELSLRENVAFGDIGGLGDDGRLNHALAQAGVDFRELDAPLGKLEEGGTDLSGGEWQRLAVARALMSRSGFLILDEPTASLDPVAESRLYQQFLSVTSSRSAIVISHRLASARGADRILVLEEGLIAESGSHDELMRLGGIYAGMFTSQSAWYAGEAL